MKKKWVFRVASNPEAGGGHVMRSLSLARELHRYEKVHFLLCPGGEYWIEKIKKHGIGVSIASNFYIKNISNFVVDGYDFTDAEFRAWRDNCDRLIFIDDNNLAPVYADVVIAPGIPDYKSSWGNQVVLSGAQYSLLSPEYSNSRPLPSISHVQSVLITCGLRDSIDCSGKALRALANLGFNGSVTVAIGGGAPHLKSLKAAISLYKCPISIVVDADGLFSLLLKSDVVIGTGGIGLLERMAVGRPSVTVVTAGNQIQQAKWAEEIGGTILVNGLGQSFEHDFSEALNRLLLSKEQRKKMSVNGMKAVDGKGVERVTKYLLDREI